MFWVGGYGHDMDGTAKGIGTMSARADGSLAYAGVAVETPSPSYLVERGGRVYSSDEGRSTVSSYLRSGDRLVVDGTVDSAGQWPCHVALMDDVLVVANYNTGTLAVVALDRDGAAVELTQTLTSPDPQGHAHASLRLGPDWLISADLGAERLLLHTLRGAALERTGEVAMPAGTGPRDLVSHEAGLLYVLGEHGGTVTVYDPVEGALELVTSIPLPGFEPGDQAAAMSFGADGFLYAGVRGSNRVAVLKCSPDGRRIEPIGWVDCEGDHPRHLTVHDGILHVANQNTNAVASFRLESSGLPELIRVPEFVPSPTFILRAQ
ncbi:MAG: beta-propeller fold lactonase family protein [Rhodoglobus sp.]